MIRNVRRKPIRAIFRILFFAGILEFTSIGASWANAKSVSQANSPFPKKARLDMNQDVFGMTEEEYFISPLQRSPEIGRRLIREKFDGVMIGAPDYIALDKHSRFPVVAMRVTDSRIASLYLFKEYALITAVGLETGEFSAEFFVEQKFAKTKRDPVKNPPPPGRSSDGAAADLFSRIGLPAKPGDYLVTAIVLDKPSNRIRVRVGDSKYSNEPEMFKKVLEQSLGGNLDNRKSGMEGVLAAARTSNAPPIPEEFGIRGKLESIPEGDGSSGSLSLHASYRLPNPASFHILVTGTRVPAPMVWRIGLPISKETGSEGSSAPKGSFSVDMNRLVGIESNQTIYLYVFSGIYMLGPLKVTWGKNSPNLPGPKR